MSHSNTPHLPNRGESNRLDSTHNVNDGLASNSKQLLNAYVYDFLVKNRLAQTARIFVNEAEIPSDTNVKTSPNDKSSDKFSNSPTNSTQFHKENNLPLLKVAMNAPQGFLYEWWLVFWDVYQAKSDKLPNSLAGQYYQLQLMKQKQQQEFQQMTGMNNNGNFNPQYNPTNAAHHYPTGPGPVNGPPGPSSAASVTTANGAGSQADIQQAQQRMMMQLMMNKQQAAAQNPNFNQMDPQQQQQYLASMNANGQNAQQQQQMFMMQQQQNIAAQNKIQQHAQNQMNNLRQQAAAQRLPDQSPQTSSNVNRGPSLPPNANPRGSQSQVQGNDASPGTTQGPPNGQFQHNGFPNGGDSNQARMNVNFDNNNGKSSNVNMANNNTPINTRNINALHDYQMQLMLLEKQNKKRLDIARNSGSGESNALTTLTAGMLPPNQQQMQQIQQMQQMQQIQQQNNSTTDQMINQQNGSSAANPNITPTNPSKASPTIGNKASPKKGKVAGANKRGRKPSGSAGNNSATPNNTATPSHLKREFSTPLTPTSETPNDSSAPANKRKRKNSNNNNNNNGNTDSPKVSNKSKKENADTIKEEKEVKNEEGSLNTMVQNSILASSFNDIGHGDQMFTMDVLDEASNQEQLFGEGNHNSNGLEDMDFDFNSFLDNNVNDRITTFNWGGVDAVEDS